MAEPTKEFGEQPKPYSSEVNPVSADESPINESEDTRTNAASISASAAESTEPMPLGEAKVETPTETSSLELGLPKVADSLSQSDLQQPTTNETQSIAPPPLMTDPPAELGEQPDGLLAPKLNPSLANDLRDSETNTASMSADKSPESALPDKTKVELLTRTSIPELTLPPIPESVTHPSLQEQPIASHPLPGWAPLIYGRTHDVDFRFLVTPIDFTNDHKDGIWDYIKVTTRAAETLSNNPRWLFYRGQTYCIVGVTCLIRDLMSALPEIAIEHLPGDLPDDMTQDRLGRPLFAFIGYVARIDHPVIIPERNLKHFLRSYLEFVPKKWTETYATLGRDPATSGDVKSFYQVQFCPEDGVQPDKAWQPMLLDQLLPQSPQGISLWNIAEAQNIWWTAAKTAHPLSICIGNLSRRDLVNSRFRVAVIEEVQQHEVIRRLEEEHPPSQSPNPSSQNQPAAQDRVHASARRTPPDLSQLARGLGAGLRKGTATFFGRAGKRQLDKILVDMGPIEYWSLDDLLHYERELRAEIEEGVQELRHLRDRLVQWEQQGHQRSRAYHDARVKYDEIQEDLQEGRRLLIDLQNQRSRKEASSLRYSDSPEESLSSSQSRPDPMKGFKEKVIEPANTEDSQSREDSSSEQTPKKDIWDF
jgi:hypothetical protein